MRHLILAAFLATILPVLSAQEVYLKYDPAYFDRMEYRFTENHSNVSYYSYRLNKSADEKIFFETGIENTAVRKKVPGTLKNATEIIFDQNDVKAINAGTKKVFVVKPVTGGYLVLPVGSAEFMYYKDNLLVYEGTDYALQADFNAVLPENLASGNSASTIYYGGSLSAYGRDAYMFTRTPIVQSSKQTSVLTILPQLGLLQERIGEASNFQLFTINGGNPQNFVPQITTTQQYVTTQASQPLPSTYETISTRPSSVITQSEEITAQPIVLPPSQSYVSATQPYGISTQTYVVPSQSYSTITSLPYAQTYSMPQSYSTTTTQPYVSGSQTYTMPASSYTTYSQPYVSVPQTYSTTTIQPDVTTTTQQEVTTTPVEQPAVAYNTNPCDVVAGDGEYVVQAGQSLYGIARLLKLSVGQLRQWNNLTENNSTIYPCSKLIVAGPAEQEKAVDLSTKGTELPSTYSTVVTAPTAAPAPCPQTGKAGEHIVQPGETIYSIGRNYGISPESIIKWNDFQMRSNSIFPCQRLLVSNPNMETSVSTKGVVAHTTVKHVNKAPTHTIKKSTSELTAKSVTSKGNALYVKKGLDLHVVKKGESISTIAKEYGMTISQFRALNKLGKSETIIVGQVVRTKDCTCDLSTSASHPTTTTVPSLLKQPSASVPKTYSYVYNRPATSTGSSSSQLSAKGVDAAPKHTSKYHVVQENETLESIAEQFGMTVAHLRAINSLDKSEIAVPNQLLTIE